MSKRPFDILLIVPLEEELLEVQKVFKSIEDLSTDTIYRHLVDTGDPSLSMLIVQQEGMGRTSARDAVESAFDEFDFSLVICLGIAGSLTNDLQLCDVCYSYEVYDVYDNTKAHEGRDGDLDIAFSPYHEKCCEPIVAAINFIRTQPSLQDLYAEWQLERESVALALFPHQVLGRGGSLEKIAQPDAINCKVVCAAVSNSERYNKKIRDVDRKIFAIETESGGIMAALRRRKVESLTIRGISDYADRSKDQLEAATGGKIRSMAASNAATFLKLQFRNHLFRTSVERLRSLKVGDGQSQLPLVAPVKKDITALIAECAESIEAKLRELSHEFKLLEKGYRLPIPRMRNVQYVSGLGTKFSSDPEEVRDALERHSVILLGLAKNYPDDSLPWIIASDLLTAVVGGKQMVPVVIDGEAVRPPRLGLKEAAHWDFSEVDETAGAQLVFIVDGPAMGSKTKLDFLIKCIKAQSTSRFIIISKDETKIISESKLATRIGAEHYLLSNVSFSEIAHFVEKNFNMTAIEAEVIALRLNDTFNSFDLSAHPTYFAGISKEMLSMLLQANRRAELIELAVGGFLSLVVAADKAAVKLTRTTRARFLQMIVTELKLERRSLSRGDVVAMAAGLAEEYGYDIDPTGFVLSFVDSGIVHFVDDRVVFSLPFMESYLLAVELTEAPQKALAYFDPQEDYIDLGTFDIYCEIKPSPDVIERVMRCVEQGRDALALTGDEAHVLLTNAARPAMLANTERLKQIEERFQRLSDDVRTGRGDVKRKQKMLDMVDRLRDAASDRSGLAEDDQEETPSEDFRKFADGMRYWTTGVQMLGSAAEHLPAEAKVRLSGMLVEMVSLLAHVWIKFYTNIDFNALRKDFTSDENIEPLLNRLEDKADLTETRRQVESMVDLLEFSMLAHPLRRLLHELCERARLRVLAVNVEKAVVASEIDQLAHALWLADIDGKRGHDALIRAMKHLPPSPFLRIVVATHLMTRVYWNQSEAADRLRFLDAAEIALGSMVGKGEIIRYIEANAPKTQTIGVGGS